MPVQKDLWRSAFVIENQQKNRTVVVDGVPHPIILLQVDEKTVGVPIILDLVETFPGVYEVKKGVKKRARGAGDGGEDDRKVRNAKRARPVIELEVYFIACDGCGTTGNCAV